MSGGGTLFTGDSIPSDMVTKETEAEELESGVCEIHSVTEENSSNSARKQTLYTHLRAKRTWRKAVRQNLVLSNPQSLLRAIQLTQSTIVPSRRLRRDETAQMSVLLATLHCKHYFKLLNLTYSGQCGN